MFGPPPFLRLTPRKSYRSYAALQLLYYAVDIGTRAAELPINSPSVFRPDLRSVPVRLPRSHLAHQPVVASNIQRTGKDHRTSRVNVWVPPF